MYEYIMEMCLYENDGDAIEKPSDAMHSLRIILFERKKNQCTHSFIFIRIMLNVYIYIYLRV